MPPAQRPPTTPETRVTRDNPAPKTRAHLATVNAWWDHHNDPAAFARDVLGLDLWARQREIARALRDHPRVAVRSCHAAGKTLLAAACVCWFLYTRRDAVVLTTASTFRQVRYVLWRTIQSLVAGAPRPLGGALLDTELRLGPRWYGLGLSTDHPERFQGFHAPHLLVVVDEPGAVPPGVFAAIEGVLASGHTRLLMIGNPTQPDGPFFDAFHAQAGAYRTFRISALDTPNLRPHAASAPPRPYLVSRQWVDERRRLWGPNSDLYRSRVLAEFPRRAADQLFPLALLDAATDPEPPPAASPRRAALGVDLARFGDDATAFTWIEDGRLTRQLQYRGVALMDTAGRIIEALQERPGLALALDDTGLGGGVTDRLHEQGWEPLAVNFGAAAHDRDHYANRSAELYSRLARALEDGDLRLHGALPYHDALNGQLSGVRYQVASDGRRAVRKRGPDGGPAARSASPDLADSLALAWAAYEEGLLTPGVY